jgi:hypothetical protein
MPGCSHYATTFVRQGSPHVISEHNIMHMLSEHQGVKDGIEVKTVKLPHMIFVRGRD